MKLFFESKELAEAYSAAEAEYRGCNMESTIFWYDVLEDGEEVDNEFVGNGSYYCLV